MAFRHFDEIESGPQRYWTPEANVRVPLSVEERASQIASARRWRVFGEEFAEGAGWAGAVYPLAGEAIVDAAEVVRDLYSDFQAVGRKRKYQNYSRYYPMVAPTKRARIGYGRVKPGTNNGGMYHYTTENERSGRRTNRARKRARLVDNEILSVISQFVGVNRFSGSQGMFSMYNIQNDSNNMRRIPWHVYDITAHYNYDGHNAVDMYPYIGYEFLVDNQSSNGALVSHVIRGSDGSGNNFTQNSFCQVKYYGTQMNLTPNLTVGERGILDWVDIRFVFYAMANTMTRFTVELIQINDDSDDWSATGPFGATPTHTNTETATAGTTSLSVGGEGVYNKAMEMMRPYLFNPIMPSNGRKPNLFKVLKRKDFVIHPRDTNKADTNTPACHEYRLFHRLNRGMKFNYLDDDNRTGFNFNVNDVAMEDVSRRTTSRLSPTVHPKARIFLSIKSNAVARNVPNPDSGGEFVASNHRSTTTHDHKCSYDMVIRRKTTHGIA